MDLDVGLALLAKNRFACPGVDVMITILGKNGVFLKNQIQIFA
jgi:hypothetical protein